MVDYLKLTFYAMYYSILIYGILSFFFNPHHLYPVFILVSLFLIVNFSRYFFKLSDKESLAVVMATWFTLLGERFTLGLYDKFFYYDKIVHFVFFFVIAILIYNRLKKCGLRENLFIFVVLSSLGIGSIVEIYEYTYDIFFNQGMQGVFDASFHTLVGGLADTIWDMILNLAGSITACIWLFKLNKNSKSKELKT